MIILIIGPILNKFYNLVGGFTSQQKNPLTIARRFHQRPSFLTQSIFMRRYELKWVILLVMYTTDSDAEANAGSIITMDSASRIFLIMFSPAHYFPVITAVVLLPEFPGEDFRSAC